MPKEILMHDEQQVRKKSTDISDKKSKRVSIEEESESVELTPELTSELTPDDDEDGPEFNYYEEGND
ncbi:21441_t:CDS:2, partial [Racocetra persica]